MPIPVAATSDYRFAVVGGSFPPGLNTSDDPTAIDKGETPDGYGFDIKKDGRLKRATIPTGTSRIEKTASLSWSDYAVQMCGATTWVTSTAYVANNIVVNSSTVYVCASNHTSGVFATDLAAGRWVETQTFKWYYERMWLPIVTNLVIGAKDYDDVYVPQMLGKVPFNEDTSPIVNILPVALDEMLVLKATGSYVLANLGDSRMSWPRTSIMQELSCATSTHCVEVDGIGFVSNANGLIAYQGGQTKDMTRKVRDNLTNFSSQALTADYINKYVIGTSFALDIETGKIFRYSGSSFLYTSPVWHMPDWSPVKVDRLIFVVEHGDTSDYDMTINVKFEDDDWSDDYYVPINYDREQFSTVSFVIPEGYAAAKFQMKITDLPATKYIREIRVDADSFDFDSYKR